MDPQCIETAKECWGFQPCDLGASTVRRLFVGTLRPERQLKATPSYHDTTVVASSLIRFWSTILNTAVVSETSSMPQNDISNKPGLHSRHVSQQASRQVSWLAVRKLEYDCPPNPKLRVCCESPGLTRIWPGALVRQLFVYSISNW